MKVAVATTTIHVPYAITSLLRSPNAFEIHVFVAGDHKTPQTAYTWARGLEGVTMLSPDAQTNLGYACSRLIGWNCIQRRNIAILEALRWGADVIVLWDDDNLPLNANYLVDFAERLSFPLYGSGTNVGGLFSGLMACGSPVPSTYGADGWFDVGELLVPRAPHRGFPYPGKCQWRYEPAVGAQVGVSAGVCLGNPDIGAVERMANSPTVYQVSELLREGIVVDTNLHTVFNSQNTAFVRELAPAFLLCPQFRRYDDILASLVVQRVMRERDMHVHFGKPYIWQQRNTDHNLLKDLADETWGMNHIVAFAECLDGIKLSAEGSVIEHTGTIYREVSALKFMPAGVLELAGAWLADCQKVTG